MAQQQTWSSNEDVILFRAMVAKLLSSRADLYATPDLAPWSGNGGNRINQKVQQLLKKFGSSIPGAADVVNEEVSNITQAKKGATPTKVPKGTATSSSETPSPKKKRKRAAVVKNEDEDDFDDY